jgi:hypothetical protein
MSLMTRRDAATLLLTGTLIAQAHAAAPVLVEVFAYAHPPVAEALKPVREMLARQGAAVRVVEIDLDQPEAEKRVAALGIKGHVAALIMVAGQRSFRRPDGSALEFVNFPAGSAGPVAMRNSWTPAELQAVIAQYKGK